MNGAELSRHLVALGRLIPTIFITAYREENTVIETRASGAACFLTKPFDAQVLMDCVRKAVAGQPH